MKLRSLGFWFFSSSNITTPDSDSTLHLQTWPSSHHHCCLGGGSDVFSFPVHTRIRSCSFEDPRDNGRAFLRDDASTMLSTTQRPILCGKAQTSTASGKMRPKGSAWNVKKTEKYPNLFHIYFLVSMAQEWKKSISNLKEYNLLFTYFIQV